MGPKKHDKPERGRIMMPIGEYANNYIDEIPNYYLKWVAENWQEDSAFKKRLIKECDDEVQWRKKNDVHISKDDFLGGKVKQ